MDLGQRPASEVVRAYGESPLTRDSEHFVPISAVRAINLSPANDQAAET
jgi:hypothetical protein